MSSPLPLWASPPSSYMMSMSQSVVRRGFLRAFLYAVGGAAVASSTTLRVWAAEEPFHPRLFFGPDELEGLRRKCATWMRPQLEVLRKDAESRLEMTPPSELHGGYERRGNQLQDPFLANILAFSFLAVVTGEARYRDAAKSWALRLAEMPEWVGVITAEGKCGNCGYPEGWAVTALAVAYDWLYPDFSDDQRALLRRKIALLSRVLYEGTFRGEWWTGAYLHHDTWIPIGGLGVGAMAIVDEVPEAATWADRATHELLSALDWLDSDGAWPEGPCGWAFAMISAFPFFDAYARRFPERASAILGNPWLQNTWKFRLYSRTPDGLFLAFGDCAAHGGYQQNAVEAAPLLRYLAARYRNPYAQWLASREWEQHPNPHTAVWEAIWMDPDVPEAPPTDLPRAILFDNQGIAYLHTSRDMNATVLAFRGSSLLGRRAASLFHGDRVAEFNNSTTHAHADGASFGVWSRGRIAVPMAGYGQRETEFQSSLLVDGQGQYSRFGEEQVGRPDGLVTAFFWGRRAGFVEGDATRCYPPGLSRFRRRVYLVEPGLVFVVDDIAADRPVSLEWRVHADGNSSLTLERDGFTSTLEGWRTRMRASSTDTLELDHGLNDRNRAVLMRLANRTTAARLAMVVVPSIPPDETASIEVPTERSFVIQALHTTTLAAFAMGSSSLEVPSRLTGEGLAAIVGGDGFLAVEATRLSANGEALLSASRPVNVSLWRSGSSGTLVVSAPQAAEVSVGTRLPNATIRGGGAAVTADSSGRATLRVPEGESSYQLD